MDKGFGITLLFRRGSSYLPVFADTAFNGSEDERQCRPNCSCVGGEYKKSTRSAPLLRSILVCMRRWILISFLIGFALVGGLLSLLVTSEFLDVHQQSYDPDAVLPNVLRALALFGMPGGILAVILTGCIRWTVRHGWWRGSKPET